MSDLTTKFLGIACSLQCFVVLSTKDGTMLHHTKLTKGGLGISDTQQCFLGKNNTSSIASSLKHRGDMVL